MIDCDLIRDPNYRARTGVSWAEVMETEPFLEQFWGGDGWESEIVEEFLGKPLWMFNGVKDTDIINKLLEEGWKRSIKGKISKVLQSPDK